MFLLLLDAEGGKAVPGNLWLQKELFLIGKNLQPLEDYLSFEPHLQGPYSDVVEDITESLEYTGLVKKSKGDISLTDRGQKVAEILRQSADDYLLDLIFDVKRLANDLSKDELLVYVYYTYPGMTDESVVKPDVEEKREDIAQNLYHNGKVSIEKAAQLAGTEMVEFAQRVRA